MGEAPSLQSGVLTEEYWLDDTAYDALSMRIIFNFQQWNSERVWQSQQIIQRCNLDIYSVSTIVEKVAETLPQLAPRILRAHLDYRLEHQAYGELLFIHYSQYQDEWSVAKIDHYLITQDDEAVLCGLAHVASHMWLQRRCRAKAADILYNLAPSNIEAIQSAVARVFFQSREHFELDSGMRLVIQAVCKNKQLFLKAASDIIEIIENNSFVDTEPQLVSEICQSLLSRLGKELDNPTRPLVFAAESLTTFAIQLHRQDKYRQVGLKIFEQLLSLNLRETRSALETLDRKPNRLSFYQAPRRNRRRRGITPSNN